MLKVLEKCNTGGLAGSSLYYYMAQHFESGLIVLNSDQNLESAASALQFFTGEKTEILTFPSFITGYEMIREDPQNSFQRIHTQLALCKTNKGRRFVLTNSIALSQKILLPQNLSKMQIHLKKEGFVDRDDFIRQLKSVGYLQDELAQDQGFFSVRGHLVDVYMPSNKLPFRIEFFGDEIVSIRNFDPNSQRSTSEIESITISPCREIHLSSEVFKQAKIKLKDLGDSMKVDREDREEILWQLENQRHLIQARWLLPAFSNQLCSLFDYLPKNFPLISTNLKRNMLELQQSLQRDKLHYQELETLAFPPNKLRENIAGKLELSPIQLSSEIRTDADENIQTLDFESLRSQLSKEKSFKCLETLIQDLSTQGQSVQLVFQSLKKMDALRDSLLEVQDKIDWKTGEAFDGFSSKTFSRAYITETDIFGKKSKSAGRFKRVDAKNFLREFSELSDNDYVVHEEHGIAKFKGLVTLNLNDFTSEFALLEYADEDKLYLPITRLDQVSRYVHGDNLVKPRLDKLGSQIFQKKRRKAKDDILKIAHELVELAAKRSLQHLDRPSINESKYADFCTLFPYELTPDQARAINEIESELSQQRPIDRLVCGDVGFGKTEVALRACMLRALQGVQIALLAPTTLLTEQHYASFRSRLSDFGLRVARLSRFVPAAEQKLIIEKLKQGQIDVIIGTHRLFQRDVSFKNLGMLIIDEEQRFGVKHKEKIKKLRAGIDVVTLSATPIPRTLQMSIVGIRDLSLIVTPPETREAVETRVGAFDPKLIREASKRELERGGQILFVHNRVRSINNIEERLKEIIPEAKIVVGHGQMPEAQLEKVMHDFFSQKANVLLATSIIENGLDMPNANTIFIDHAEHFGLADLYQLRGRVGRSNRKAFSYFLVHDDKPLTLEASKRLQVIQTCTELGSGFKIASHDLEIRGSGNLLGEQQSGVISEIGLELYNQMLHECISDIKNEKKIEPLPELNSGYSTYIPDTYIPDAPVRISTYRRLNKVSSLQELLNFEGELLDRFGLYPLPVENFCQIIRLRLMVYPLKAKSIDCFPGKITLDFHPDTPLARDRLIQKLNKTMQFDSKGRLLLHFESAINKPEILKEHSKFENAEAYDFDQARRLLQEIIALDDTIKEKAS